MKTIVTRREEEDEEKVAEERQPRLTWLSNSALGDLDPFGSQGGFLTLGRLITHVQGSRSHCRAAGGRCSAKSSCHFARQKLCCVPWQPFVLVPTVQPEDAGAAVHPRTKACGAKQCQFFVCICVSKILVNRCQPLLLCLRALPESDLGKSCIGCLILLCNS